MAAEALCHDGLRGPAARHPCQRLDAVLWRPLGGEAAHAQGLALRCHPRDQLAFCRRDAREVGCRSHEPERGWLALPVCRCAEPRPNRGIDCPVGLDAVGGLVAVVCGVAVLRGGRLGVGGSSACRRDLAAGVRACKCAAPDIGCSACRRLRAARTSGRTGTGEARCTHASGLPHATPRTVKQRAVRECIVVGNPHLRPAPRLHHRCEQDPHACSVLAVVCSALCVLLRPCVPAGVREDCRAGPAFPWRLPPPVPRAACPAPPAGRHATLQPALQVRLSCLCVSRVAALLLCGRRVRAHYEDWP